MHAPRFGIPMYGSPHVPQGQLVRFTDPTTNREGIYFHERLSIRQKHRRGHGMSRRHKRKLRVKGIIYRPDYDRLREMAA